MMSNYRRVTEKRIRASAHSQSKDSYCQTGPAQHDWGFTSAAGIEDIAGLKAYWQHNRERLLADWIRAKPGTRPWAWWKLDMPAGTRREIRVGARLCHPHDDPQRKLHVCRSNSETMWRRAYSLTWGLPDCFIPPFDSDCIADFHKNFLRDRTSEIFEEEWSYLQRHGLLLPGDSP